MSVGTDIYERALKAMDDIIGRIVRAQRMSGVRESGVLKRLREDYRNVSVPGGKRYAEAHAILENFVRAAQGYLARASSNVTYVKQWTRYEDQRLRKPVRRLVQIQAESARWEALRKLQDSSGPIRFFVPPNGTPVQVKMLDWAEHSLFDTITLAKASP